MWKRKIKGIIRLFRPYLSLAASICVVGGQIIAYGQLPSLPIVLLGFLCALGLSGAALVVNDYFDYEVDRINAPERPLPSGAVTRREALLLGVIATLVGLASAALLGMDCFIVAFIFWGIGFLYNWRFKQTGLPGNLMVSSSVAITFILGAMSVHQPGNPIVLIFSLIAFFINLGEEITGDALDLDGDMKRGTNSIAKLKGKRFALNLAVILWGLVIPLGLIPVVLGFMGTAYLVTILAVDLLIIFFSIRLLNKDDVNSQRGCMKGIYMGATLLILTFFIGQIPF
jgi:geranylgeranylglycerol-phosphate geranylgeranyltransferase